MSGEPQEVTFERFLMLMATQALIALGAAENPHTGRVEPNLDGARYTIDVLGMLEEKTRGNLTEREQTQLANVLHELRMRYVDAVERGGTGRT